MGLESYVTSILNTHKQFKGKFQWDNGNLLVDNGDVADEIIQTLHIRGEFGPMRFDSACKKIEFGEVEFYYKNTYVPYFQYYDSFIGGTPINDIAQ